MNGRASLVRARAVRRSRFGRRGPAVAVVLGLAARAFGVLGADPARAATCGATGMADLTSDLGNASCTLIQLLGPGPYTATGATLAVVGTNVTLDLNGQTVNITGATGFAGINVPQTKSLTIQDSNAGTNSLTVTGGADGGPAPGRVSAVARARPTERSRSAPAP
jgi:hypothetical protein